MGRRLGQRPRVCLGMPSVATVRRATQRYARVVKKKVIVLYTDEILVNDKTKDTVIPIGIHAYAIDDKMKIVIDKETTFTFPRVDLLKEGKED